MTVYELQESYKSGDSTWTKHGQDGLRPNTVQYDLNGGAEHHITVDHDVKGEITGLHYTIRNEANTLFHLYYYADKNQYFIDFKGTRNPQTIDIQLIKSRLADWCVVSQYALQADKGSIQNLKAFKKEIAAAEERNRPKQSVNKKGQIVLDLTGGGQRGRY